jgi:hypothetical protein
VLAAPSAASAACPWVGSTAPVEQRVNAVLAQMTLDEEIALVHGTFPGFYGGYLAPIPRLCIPAIRMLNGPASAGEPPKQLKGFRRVMLTPGQSRQVTFRFGIRALAHFDVATDRWIAPAGTYTVMAGDSSRNLPSTKTLTLSQALVSPT